MLLDHPGVLDGTGGTQLDDPTLIAATTGPGSASLI
jgi:hypothetical protein